MKKTLQIALAALLLVNCFAAPTAGDKGKKKKNVHEIKKNLKNVRNKKHDVRVKLIKARKDAGKVRLTIQQIDSKISAISDRMVRTERRLETAKVEQVQVAKELEDATKRLQVRSEQARTRLRQIYMHGQVSLASAIVGSKSFGELASRKFVFQRIAERDRELFEEVRQLKRRVEDKKVQADRLVVEIHNLMNEQATEKANLQDTRADKREALAELKAQVGSLEQVLQELDQEENSLTASIEAYNAGPGRSTGLVFNGRFLIPVNGARFASGFGMRFHPILHRNRMHTGQDLAAPWGTPIHASADGIVIGTRYMRGYGNALIIDHGSGVSTLYGHCSSILVSGGQRVKRGEVVAKVGATGLATGPHCHWEIRINGRPVNPMGRVSR